MRTVSCVVGSLLLFSLSLFIGHEDVLAYEEPRYRVIAKDGNLELTHAESHIVAKTIVDGDFNNAGKEGFRRLYRYISGNNRELPATEIKLQSGLPCFNDRTYRVKLLRQRPLSPQAFCPVDRGPVRGIPPLLCEH